mmetsp:Transcript_16999/g.27926  ORF Transcript_16999/g.27926 Transcript_16999/m.27926 type:complete len:157 (+) Transcript_16999:922-1392(+)
MQSDYYTEYVSLAPKSYSLRSKSKKNCLLKMKGFSLHEDNQKIVNFETLKTQVLAMAMEVSKEDMPELVMHKNETKMEKRFFTITVNNNKGKVLHRAFDKRKILPPVYNSKGELRMVDTIPWFFKGGKMELTDAHEIEEDADEMMMDLTQVVDFEI